MKIVKRNGKIVDYNADKIRIAIKKANNDVSEDDVASDAEINKIIKYIETTNKNKKRLLVEDIQDIIEKKLVELNKYELSKSYMLYRYERELIRKANTTDESILTLIKNSNKEIEENSNKNATIASTQRDLIAGEVSKDLTRRILLPEKISQAHEEGILHFHDADYFLQPIFNSCLINIEDMLDNGTVINGKLIETPKSFQVACTVLTQIVAAVASSQYGGQSINIKHLSKYLKNSENKFKQNLTKKFKDKFTKEEIKELVKDRLAEELSAGVQTLEYQINTLMTTNGQAPFLTIFMYLDKDDPYLKYTAMIIEEILNQRYQGIKDENGIYITLDSPKLVYVLDENNCLNGGKYDYLTRLAIKCSSKRLYPDYISAKKMRENYEGNVFSPIGYQCFLAPYKDENGNYKFEGRFNQGIVSINLPQIAILAEGNEKKFFELLDERLDLCYEALMCRHHALLGTLSNISPIHWQYGAIARLNKNEVIDKYLKNGYSTLSLGYIGIYEMTKLMKGVSHTDPIGKTFALKVMKIMKARCDKWKKETGISFGLYGTPIDTLGYRFARIDKERFGIIKDVTDKGYYTNSYHINEKEKIDNFSRLKFESEFQTISVGGAISYVDISNMDFEALEDLIKFIYQNIQYVKLTMENNSCYTSLDDKEITKNDN